MCGITGVIRLKNNVASLAPLIHEMTCAISHRGPDDEGFLLVTADSVVNCSGDTTPGRKAGHHMAYPDRHIREVADLSCRAAFGHRRLSILDLSPAGHQPMRYLDRYWIVFNGEIYNYVELKEELQRAGYGFSSGSDTEVIMAAYHCWGTMCVKRFNGMWAFVIYDEVAGTIFISRDRFGIKPIYYYCDNDWFAFASEIKALLKLPFIAKKVNYAYCAKYLRHGPADHLNDTAFEGIFRFGCCTVFEAPLGAVSKSGLAGERFWDYTINTSMEPITPEKAQAYATQYYELLKDAVRLRLRADVKIGSALSGGLDSSSITYLINEVLRECGANEKLETFSSVFSAPGTLHCDESSYVEQLAGFLNVKSNRTEPPADQLLAEHRKVIYHFDNPPGGLNMGGWYTFKLIGSTDVVINLDGQGADEQLAGYYKYIWRYITNLPLQCLFRESMALLCNVPGIDRIKIVGSMVLNLLRKTVPEPLLVFFFRILGLRKTFELLRPVNEELYSDTHGILINLLHYGDCQSMANSIESRMPFMDYRLFEFTGALPATYKIHDGWTKYIARLAFKGKLPEEITWRRDKMGWTDPALFWIQGQLREPICATIEGSPLLREMGVVYDIRQKIADSRNWSDILHLFNLCVWYDVYFCSSPQ